MIGRQISHYRILEKLGEGGMGVVYKAEDTKLDRIVALKFLRPDILPSEQDRARFLHEAKAASALEHNNICSIHGMEEDEDGRVFICMAFYEGETLRAKIDRGPLKIADAIDTAIQIAEGLEEAHGKGVIHRDIKSGNIIVTPKGQIKITDFGLARLEQSTRLTTTGVTLGTAAYMSPEQIRGEQIDHRTDIWSTGVVLYEMVAGRLPFLADHEQAIMYMIANQEPEPLTGLRTGVPMELERITKKALAKLPSERYQSAADLVADLRALQRKSDSEKLAASGTAGQGAPNQRSLRKRAMVESAIVLAAAVCVLIVVWIRREDPLPPAHSIQVTNADALQTTPALSPDGGRIAYVSNESGNSDVYVIDVRGGSPLNLTDAPSSDYDPNWFPDGSSVAFVSDRNGQESIWKVGQFGGNAMLLLPKAKCPAISPDGKKIAFSRASPRGTLRIAVAALNNPGNVVVLTGDDDGLWDHLDPAWSPDGSEICYSARHDLWLVASGGGKARRLTSDKNLDSHPTWSPNGRHVYFSSYRESTLALWRVRVKVGRPQRVTLGVGRETSPTLSRDGKRLAYSTRTSERDVVIRDLVSRKETRLPGLKGGNMPNIAPDDSKIVFTSDRWGRNFDLWLQPLDLTGRVEYKPARLTDLPGNASHPVFSPDGKWIAYFRIVGEERDIWIVPSNGGQSTRFLEHPVQDVHPAWSPDGLKLAFASERGGGSHIWVAQVIDGKCSGSPVQITRGELWANAPSWSPDGSRIAFVGVTEDDSEVWTVPADGSTVAHRVTKGAGAVKVKWEPSGNSLLVSGTWGQRHVSLRKVSLSDGRAREMVPQTVFGQEAGAGIFDLSRDGRLLAYCKGDSKGNIWVSEAEKGSY